MIVNKSAARDLAKAIRDEAASHLTDECDCGHVGGKCDAVAAIGLQCNHCRKHHPNVRTLMSHALFGLVRETGCTPAEAAKEIEAVMAVA